MDDIRRRSKFKTSRGQNIHKKLRTCEPSASKLLAFPGRLLHPICVSYDKSVMAGNFCWEFFFRYLKVFFVFGWLQARHNGVV